MKRILIIIILPVFICLVPMLAWAGTYYVSFGATGSWADAVNRSTPTSYAAANTNAVAGDIVIFINDGGTFTNPGSSLGPYIIDPVNNGTPGNPITFKGEDGTTVILDAENLASINLIDSSYINIENFTVGNDNRAAMWIDARNISGGGTTHHITISDSSFESKRDYMAGLYFSGNAHHITIKNSTFDAKIGSDEGHYDAIYFVASRISGVKQTMEYILIEDNDIYGSNHVGLEFQKDGGMMQYIVVRNNTIHNPNHTSLNVYGGGSFFLIENNSLYDAGSICSTGSCQENVWGSSRDRGAVRDFHHNLQLWASNSIVRNNLMYNGGKGMIIDNVSTDNMIYNNVMYKNCQGLSLNTTKDVYNNVFKNNIMKDNDTNCYYEERPLYVSLTGDNIANEWMYNVFDDANPIRYSTTDDSNTQGNLTWLETNISTIFHANMEVEAGFVDAPNYDFNLASGSFLINKGGFLTYTNGSGINSNTIVVDDARYFTDGWGLIDGDLIQIRQVGQVRITNVDYSTNTVTIDQNISWKDNQGVSLVYKGLAPDIGAYESESVSSPPSLIKIQ